MVGAPEKLLLETIRGATGLDFSWFRRSIFLDRVRLWSGNPDPADRSVLEKLKTEEFLHNLLLQLYPGSPDFYRDPLFYRGLREQVLPGLLALRRPVRVLLPFAGGGGDHLGLTALFNLHYKGSFQILAGEYNPVRIEHNRNPLALFADREAHLRFKKSGEPVELEGQKNLIQQRFQPPGRTQKPGTDSIREKYEMICIRHTLPTMEDGVARTVFRQCRDGVAQDGYLCLGSREWEGFTDDLAGFEPVEGIGGLYRRTGA